MDRGRNFVSAAVSETIITYLPAKLRCREFTRVGLVTDMVQMQKEVTEDASE